MVPWIEAVSKPHLTLDGGVAALFEMLTYHLLLWQLNTQKVVLPAKVGIRAPGSRRKHWMPDQVRQDVIGIYYWRSHNMLRFSIRRRLALKGDLRF
jgi:hypothetical protein